MRFTHRLLIAVLLTIQVTPSFCPAQAPVAKPSLAGLYQAIGAENYPEAKRQADALLSTAAPAEKLKISLTYGRILLGLKLKEPARQYLTMMAAQNLDGDGQALMEVYTAWLESLDGKPDAAIKKLEANLQAGHRDTATLEATDILAMLYLSQGNQEGAKRAVDFGLGTLKYLSLLGKTDYIETLLRGRLQSGASDAEKLFKAAKKLQEEGNAEVGAPSRAAPELAGAASKAAAKFTEAGKLFNQVIAEYPRSEWVDPANFHLGQCLVSLDRAQDAFKHWKKFIEEKPAGPWRGQARVEIIDLALEKNLDLKMASEHALAATAALAKVAVPVPSPKNDKDSADTSWQDAAFDIHLRQGIVSLVDGRHDAAATGFTAARQTLPASRLMSSEKPSERDPVALGLERLAEAAKERAPLLPKELNAGEARTVAALSLGTVYGIVRNFESSQKFFALPLTGRDRSSSAPHRSFADLGLARAAAGTPHNPEQKAAQFKQAKSLYQQSLKEYADGSWHDETLRELALLTERIAADRFSPKATDKPFEDKKVPLTAAQRNQQAKELAVARAEALPLWLDLSKRYVKSRHMPQALYHAGVLYSEARKPADALEAFEELVTKYSDSPWTGDAQVWLIDVKLEQQFDLDGASNLAASALSWYEQVDADRVAKARKGFGEDEFDSLRSVKQVGYDIYVRAGLIEYLKDRNQQAVVFFEKAKPLQPPREWIAQGNIPTGIERLINIAKSGKSLTPKCVRDGEPQAVLVLMLVDVYHEGEEWQKSLKLCNQLIDGSAAKLTREQQSYAHFKRGRNYYSLEGKLFSPDAAFAEYASAVRSAPKADWSATAMFLAANITWNFRHDVDAAASLWHRVARNYPGTEEAERATYFVGVIYEASDRPLQAQKAYLEFIKNYSQSRFAGHVQGHLADVSRLVAESSDKKKPRSK